MKMLQKSAVMRGTDNMVIKEIPVPQIKEKEVLVSLEYVGICGSDVHYYHNGCCGAYKVDLSESADRSRSSGPVGGLWNNDVVFAVTSRYGIDLIPVIAWQKQFGINR